MRRLYDALKDCKKEDEVKSEFCKFFKMKINALKAIDHYTETVLFEFYTPVEFAAKGRRNGQDLQGHRFEDDDPGLDESRGLRRGEP